MAAHDALIEACRAAPDDDAPRLVWADAVGGERGELVVIQCDLARGELSSAEAGARRRRERELLAAHGRAWSGLEELLPELGKVSYGWGDAQVEEPRFEYRRGFVEAIELDARKLAVQAEALLQRAPLLHALTATGLSEPDDDGDPLGVLRALLASPALGRFDALDLHDLGHHGSGYLDPDDRFDGSGDDAARVVEEAGALAHLRALGVASSGLTDAGLRSLLAVCEPARLERLWLRWDELTGDAVRAVLARVPAVRSLALSGALDAETIAHALPPVTELHLSRITDETLAALGRSRAAATLETLRFVDGRLARTDGLRAFPRLSALDLGGASLADHERALADLVALPSLRRLRCTLGTPMLVVHTLARTIGPGLEELDVRSDNGARQLVDELRARVAGVVSATGELPEPLL